jgi:hypothetical protein
VQPVAMSEGRYASQGMIAPVNPFVDGDGTLTGVSFRFLYGLFSQINDLQNQVATLQQRLANAGIP